MHPNQWPVLKLVQISIAVFKNGRITGSYRVYLSYCCQLHGTKRKSHNKCVGKALFEIHSFFDG